MSRQLDQATEIREAHKRDQLVRALEFGIVGALEGQGVELIGFAIKYDAYNCLLTVRADIGGDRFVAFVGSDSIINCFLKAEAEALDAGLHWNRDKYHAR